MSDITAYTIISRDVELLDFCIGNAQERAGIDHEFLVIGWNQTKEIEEYCSEAGIRMVPVELPEVDSTEQFLSNLYCCWNLGMAEANTKWVARMGSDQYMSSGWLKELMNAAAVKGERAIYHCNTIESLVAKNSRHQIEDWGDTWQTFDKLRFTQWDKQQQARFEHRRIASANECGLHYRHPFRGPQVRPDGCTWLQTKALYDEFGPLEDTINEEGVTGDVAYMDRIYDAGVPGYLVRTSTTYHLVRGESRETQE